MSVDLTTAPDHPVRVLADWLDQLPPVHQERPGGYRCQEVLSAHEREKGVTFAALDNGALQHLQETYEKHIDTPYVMDMSPAALRDLLDAVRDLLGLED
jgi:hypothetical protein